jgi:DNA primase
MIAPLYNAGELFLFTYIMITGRRKIELTFDTILQRITEYDIFRYYIPDKTWKINKPILSPLRNEKNPSFVIGNRSGKLKFIDFGTGVRGDAFTFVKLLYNMPSMADVLLLIDKDFQLGISEGELKDDYKKITSTYSQPEDVGKRYSLIQVITRKFTKEELDYWNQYYQDIEDLKKEHVYSVKKVFLNKKLFTLSDTELRFGYFYDGYWKIYRPFAGKKNKWVPNNVPITEMDGKENIINCDVAFINKSKKDYMVMKKVFPCSCAVQNESVGCFSSENVEFIKANSDRQILSFDSDVPGVKSSQQITELFGFGYCNVPREYLSEDIKDWADLAKKYGLQRIEEILKQKQLL